MTFGERIRFARNNAAMTQAELAGDFITRNMLSKIEHDAVMPSLQTLTYLARRLHVSPSYLLGYEEKQGVDGFFTDELRSLYSEGRIDECLAVFSRMADYRSDETDLIRAMCYLGRGERRMTEGDVRGALSDFEDSLRYSACTAYASPHVIRQAKARLRQIMLIEKGDDLRAETDADAPAPFYTTAEQLYGEQIIEKALADRKLAAAEQLVDTLLPRGCFRGEKMRARVLEESGDISGAIEIMRDLFESEDISEAERYLIRAQAYDCL